MKKIILILLAFIFFGAGCAKEDFGILIPDKVRPALYGTADNLGWSGDIIEKLASAENYFGKSYIIYGPAKEDGLDSAVNDMEIIEFENPAYAQKSYKEEECFKGRGEPVKVFGMDACCINDLAKGHSSAVMTRDNYIFRAKNYFHANCGAVEYLKAFWKNYLKR